MKEADDLYVMCNSLLPGLYKVGRAINPKKRACQLMASQPFRIKVLATFPGMGFLERGVHKSLDSFKVRSGPGIEWFRCELQTAVLCILTRLQTYARNLQAEGLGHAVEGVEAALVASRGSSNAANLCGGSLGGDWVPAVDDVSAPGSAATYRDWGPIKVMPNGRQLPVFGEGGVGVLTIGQVAAMQTLDDFAFRQKAAADVLESPASRLEVGDDLERLSDETIGPL
jgi:hypothetical protein